MNEQGKLALTVFFVTEWATGETLLGIGVEYKVVFGRQTAQSGFPGGRRLTHLCILALSALCTGQAVADDWQPHSLPNLQTSRQAYSVPLPAYVCSVALTFVSAATCQSSESGPARSGSLCPESGKPPALDTAAARVGPERVPIPAEIIGYLMPSISHSLVCSIFSSPVFTIPTASIQLLVLPVISGRVKILGAIYIM